MASRAIGHALGLGIFMLIGATAGKAAADGAPCRRWGLGWGDWIGNDYGSNVRILSARYRVTPAWSLTVGGSFSIGSEAGDDHSDYWGLDDEVSEEDRKGRSFSLEASRSFEVYPRLRLGPALRFAHNYVKSEGAGRSLTTYPPSNDWRLTEWRGSWREETYRLGIGLRPEFRFHPRLSVESGVFLEYSRSHYKDSDWDRTEESDGSVDEDTSRVNTSREGWSWNLPTPSLAMGLILFFYF
jgi:hypothetical protein